MKRKLCLQKTLDKVEMSLDTKLCDYRLSVCVCLTAGQLNSRSDAQSVDKALLGHGNGSSVTIWSGWAEEARFHVNLCPSHVECWPLNNRGALLPRQRGVQVMEPGELRELRELREPHPPASLSARASSPRRCTL